MVLSSLRFIAYIAIGVLIYMPRNWDLHVTSSCHRIKVFSVNRSHPATAKRLQALDENGIDFLPLTKPLPIDLEGDDEYETEMQRRGGRDPEE